MFQLPEKETSSQSNYKDVEDDTATYCLILRASTVCFTFDDDHSTALAMPMPKYLSVSQHTDTYCQCMLKLMQSSDLRFTIDDDGLIYQEAPIEGSLQVMLPEQLRRTIP